MTAADKKASNAARQAKFRAQAQENGWVQCNVWVPAHALAEMQRLAECLRTNPNLVPATAQDQVTGKFVSLKAPRACRAA